jgi:CHAT domain-containing protein
LLTPDGRYLAEKFHIRYAQSLAVLEILRERKYDGAGKKPLLALGGAVYEPESIDEALVESEKQLEALKKSTLEAASRGKDCEQAYHKLGYGAWSALPGTLTEVRKIEEVVPGSEVLTGPQVNEGFIKSLSDQGGLREFKVIHFATHGLVVPEFPELSAIVLSQLKERNTAEDGYLRMGEIARLDIEADFVNLSACETGLGKIYGGEGVVGLTQSFLIAGARGLSVSLWQVADDSTRDFMVGMYAIAKMEATSYSRAITEMKRRFIRGEKYSEPFYWAPFVFYGN